MLVRTASEIWQARACVREVCRAHGVGHARCDDAELAVSELVGNALRHGDQPVDVEIDCQEGKVLVSVADAAPSLPVPRPHLDAADEGGRGLRLVEAVATAWGCEPNGHGKRVWALV